MQMGRNSDVKYRGLTVHIQTEDLGLGARKAMAQIFHSGQIIDSRSVSYAAHIEALESDQARDEFIRKFLDGLHRDCYKRLQAGNFDARLPIRDEPARPSPPPAFPDSDDIPVELDASDPGIGGTAGWQAVATGMVPVVPAAHAAQSADPTAAAAFRGWGAAADEADRALALVLTQIVTR
jgi:hypothetical protein